MQRKKIGVVLPNSNFSATLDFGEPEILGLITNLIKSLSHQMVCQVKGYTTTSAILYSCFLWYRCYCGMLIFKLHGFETRLVNKKGLIQGLAYQWMLYMCCRLLWFVCSKFIYIYGHLNEQMVKANIYLIHYLVKAEKLNILRLLMNLLRACLVNSLNFH